MMEMIKKAYEDNVLFQQKTPHDNNSPKAGRRSATLLLFIKNVLLAPLPKFKLFYSGIVPTVKTLGKRPI